MWFRSSGIYCRRPCAFAGKFYRTCLYLPVVFVHETTRVLIPPGPRLGKVGSDADGCNPSLGLSSVLSVSSGSSMASWYSCSISSYPMVSCKNDTSSVIIPRWSLSVVIFGDGSKKFKRGSHELKDIPYRIQYQYQGNKRIQVIFVLISHG